MREKCRGGGDVGGGLQSGGGKKVVSLVSRKHWRGGGSYPTKPHSTLGPHTAHTYVAHVMCGEGGAEPGNVQRLFLPFQSSSCCWGALGPVNMSVPVNMLSMVELIFRVCVLTRWADGGMWSTVNPIDGHGFCLTSLSFGLTVHGSRFTETAHENIATTGY